MIFTICYNKYNSVPYDTIPDNPLLVMLLDILDIGAIWAILFLTFKYYCSIC